MGEAGGAPLLVVSKWVMSSVRLMMIVGVRATGHGRGYATINMPRLPDSLPLLPLCAVKIQSQLLGRARTRLPLATPPTK